MERSWEIKSKIRLNKTKGKECSEENRRRD
jgi:hypothetical protein